MRWSTIDTIIILGTVCFLILYVQDWTQLPMLAYPLPTWRNKDV